MVLGLLSALLHNAPKVMSVMSSKCSAPWFHKAHALHSLDIYFETLMILMVLVFGRMSNILFNLGMSRLTAE